MPVDWPGVLAQVRLPLCVTQGPDHVVELLNPAAEALLAAPGALGRPLLDALPAGSRRLVELLDRSYNDGRTRHDPVQWAFPDDDERAERWFTLACSPVRDAADRVTGIVLHAAETTGHVRAQRLAEFLVLVGRVLADTPPHPAEIARRVAGLLVPRFVDRCVVELAGPGPVAIVGAAAEGAAATELPLTVGSRRVGTLRLWTGTRIEAGPVLMPEVAQLLANAMDDAARRGAERDDRRASDAAMQRSAALLQLAEALSGAVTPVAIGRLAATRAADLLGADAASVYVVGPEGVEQVHQRGWDDATAQRYRVLPLHRGRPLSDAVLDRLPVWLEDADQWRARYPEMAPVHASGGYEASACVPLRVEDRDLGAVVFSFLRPRAFDPDEREYLLAVAALCAQALDRARLYDAERRARAAAERERDRSAFLAEAGLLLDAPLSVEERLQRLAQLTVPTVADWCAVTLVRDDRIEQVAVAHADAEKVAFVRQLQERYPANPNVPGSSTHVARTGVPSFVAEIPDEMLVAAAHDAHHLELIRAIGLRSALTVPLPVRGRSLGSLTLVHAESGRTFDAADLAFAGQLAGRAALALDNARLYERQRGIARTLQSALLPGALPAVHGLELAARYLPQSEGTEVGGDVYDVIAGPEPGRCSVMLADVCGKGPEAAALTALIRHTLRAEASHGMAPAEALQRLNAAILREAPGHARFATVAHADVRTGGDGAVLSLVSAGHLPPLVLRGDQVEEVAVTGTLLGVFPDPDLNEVAVSIGPGDCLLLYTDGVTEARAGGGELYGADRLSVTLARSAGRTAQHIADDVVGDVLAFQDGRPRDDVAVLVVRAARAGAAAPGRVGAAS